MIYDTNLIIKQIRNKELLPPRTIIPIPVMGELKSFAIKANWGFEKTLALKNIFSNYPHLDISQELTEIYALIDSYSQGKLKQNPLPIGMSARNMGKNDLWIATSALYFDLELHSTDNDFDHLINFGLKFIKHNP